MNTTNSIPDLCELSVKFVVDPEDNSKLICKVDLRLNNGEIPLGDQECQVSFERLLLSVDTEGMEILSGTRFGEPRKSNTVAKVNKTSKTNKAKRGSSLNLRATTSQVPSASIEAGLTRSHDTVIEETWHADEEHHRVKARPNDRWEVTEPNREPLDGTYLESDSLFKAAPNRQANRRTASIQLKVKQRDLAINKVIRNESALNFFSRLSENQKRLIDIFIAKSLSNATHGDRRYVGEIVLSEYHFEHED